MMRKALILGLILVAASTGVSMAQQRGGGGGQEGAPRGSSRPPPQPLPRCPDLAPGAYAYVSAIPGADALAADEVALQWEVRNSGNAPYAASSAQAQTLTLEAVTAGGPQTVAETTLPAEADGAVMLGQRQSWRGYMRTRIAPELRRRTLRLHLRYAGDRFSVPNDCDLTNNEMVITSPPAAG